MGHAPRARRAAVACFIGRIANTIPVPGAASGGIVGVLLAFGVEPELALASVLAYRAVAVWVPAPIGIAALGGLRRTVARWDHADARTSDGPAGAHGSPGWPGAPALQPA